LLLFKKSAEAPPEERIFVFAVLSETKMEPLGFFFKHVVTRNELCFG